MRTMIGAIIVVFLAIGAVALFTMNQFQTTGQVVSEPFNATSPEELPTPAKEVPSTDQPAIIPKGDYNIKIINFAYSPIVLEIFEGESVLWENRDIQEHTVTSEVGSELNSPLLGKGEYYSHTFWTPGVYEYYCKPHPYMKGTIIVKPVG